MHQHSLHGSQHHCQEVAHNIKKNIQKKLTYIYNFLLDIYAIIFMIIIAQTVKVASEVIVRKRTSNSAIRIYIRNIFVFAFFLAVLPTVVAHPACRSHQHLLDLVPCHFQQLHLLNLHHSNIQPQHPQCHLHHLSLAPVHHECAYTQLQLPQDNPSLLYHPAFLYRRLTLPQSHFHLQPHPRVYQHHMASTRTVTPCSTHHHHNDLMTTTPFQSLKQLRASFIPKPNDGLSAHLGNGMQNSIACCTAGIEAES